MGARHAVTSYPSQAVGERGWYRGGLGGEKRSLVNPVAESQKERHLDGSGCWMRVRLLRGRFNGRGQTIAEFWNRTFVYNRKEGAVGRGNHGLCSSKD